MFRFGITGGYMHLF